MVGYQSEIMRSKEENDRLKRLLNIAVQRLLLHPDPQSLNTSEDTHPSDQLHHYAQTLTPSLVQEQPELPQIKEEQEYVNIQGGDPCPPIYKEDEANQNEQLQLYPTPATKALSNPSNDREMFSPLKSKSDVIKIEQEDHKSTCQSTNSLPSSPTVCSGSRELLCDIHEDKRATNGNQRREILWGSEAHQSKVTNHSNGKPHSLLQRMKGKSLKMHPPRLALQTQSIGLHKPHSCKECGKGFSFACQLEVHMRWHTKEKPYSCSVCRKSFTTLSMLRRHHRIHTGEKPFRCHVCGKCFNQSAHLNTHFRLHTRERLYRWASGSNTK